jgi:deoxyribonucleoside regulator
MIRKIYTKSENNYEQKALNNINLIIQVAEKYYIEHLTQSQIAKQIGVSRSTISRMLSRARDEGIVRIQIAHPQVRHARIEADLRKRFNLNEIIVITLRKQALEEDELRSWVGIQAAPFVNQMIQSKMVIGVGRGRTLAELAYGLSKIPNSCYDIKMVQLLGDIDIRYSPTRSTEITRLLSESYNSEAYYLNAPALVADVNLGMTLMRSSTIQQVTKFYDSLDFAMAGVGALHNSPLVLSGLLHPSDVKKLAKAGAVGDICGHFYDINGNLLDHVYSGISIGISWDQLYKCNKLLVIATGDDKVKPLLGLLRTGMIDVLVTDEHTAQKLLNCSDT